MEEHQYNDPQPFFIPATKKDPVHYSACLAANELLVKTPHVAAV